MGAPRHWHELSQPHFRLVCPRPPPRLCLPRPLLCGRNNRLCRPHHLCRTVHLYRPRPPHLPHPLCHRSLLGPPLPPPHRTNDVHAPHHRLHDRGLPLGKKSHRLPRLRVRPRVPPQNPKGLAPPRSPLHHRHRTRRGRPHPPAPTHRPV